jgi:hypothetical protein
MRPIDVCRASVDCFVVMAGMGFDARMRDVTSPERRTRAQQIGTHAVAAIADLLAVNALFRLRVAQGVLRLADKHGPVRLEAACSKAIAVGDPSYRTIKGILATGAEAEPPPEPTGDGGAVAFLHGLSTCSPTSSPCPA